MNVLLHWLYIIMFKITKLLSSSSIVSRTVLFDVKDGLITPELARVELLKVGNWYGMYKYTLLKQDSVAYEFGMPTLKDWVLKTAKTENLYTLDRILILLWNLNYTSKFVISNNHNIADTTVTIYKPMIKINPIDTYIALSRITVGKPGDMLYNMPVYYVSTMEGDIYGIPDVIVALAKLNDDGYGTNDHKTYLRHFYKMVYDNSINTLDKLEIKLRK